jgi:hypothetical protein
LRETDIQTLFRDANQVKGVFELKLCKGPSMPFSDLKEHQRNALLGISGDGFFYKIPDSPVFTGQNTRFAIKKPFDCFMLSSTPAYVVICYYIPRKQKACFYIPIHVFLEEEKKSKRKSLTYQRAHEISTIEAWL